MPSAAVPVCLRNNLRSKLLMAIVDFYEAINHHDSAINYAMNLILPATYKNKFQNVSLQSNYQKPASADARGRYNFYDLLIIRSDTSGLP
jgi:hypothetical protein